MSHHLSSDECLSDGVNADRAAGEAGHTGDVFSAHHFDDSLSCMNVVPARAGGNAIRSQERGNFQDKVILVADMDFSGVDLNGTCDGASRLEYTFGPRSHGDNPDSAKYYPAKPNPFWGAQTGLSGGIQAIRIESSIRQQDLPAGLGLDWRLGRDTPASAIGPAVMAPRLAFASSIANPVNFNFWHDDGQTTVQYNIEARTVARPVAGSSFYGLALKATHVALMPNDAAHQLLRQVGLSYQGQKQPDHALKFDLRVKVSADGSTWQGALAWSARGLSVATGSGASQLRVVVFEDPERGNIAPEAQRPLAV